MRGFLTFAVVGAVALSLSAAPAAAGPMNWTGTAMLGYSTMTNEGMPDGSIAGHLNAFAMVHPAVGIGAEAGYHSFGSLEAAGIETSLSALQFTPQMMVRSVMGPVRPYGTVGAGMYNVRATISGSGIPDVTGSETKFGFNIGAGANFKPSPGPVSFGVEARYHNVLDSAVDINSGETTSANVLNFSGGVFLSL